MLSRPTILAGYDSCVVAGHCAPSPTHADLLLRFADHPVQLRRLEMAERVQVHVGGNAGPAQQRHITVFVGG